MPGRSAQTLWKVIAISGTALLAATGVASFLIDNPSEAPGKTLLYVILTATPVALLLYSAGYIGWASDKNRSGRYQMAWRAFADPVLLALFAAVMGVRVHGSSMLFMELAMPGLLLLFAILLIMGAASHA